MITTKRLFLIPWHASDANELYELAKDPEIGHFVDGNLTKL